MAVYTRWSNKGKNFSDLFMMSMKALDNAGIGNLSLYDEVLKIKIETIDDVVLFSMVAFWKDKYYCFNHLPGREDVALAYTLEKCDMDKQLDESLASLRRLYESRA
jgi:hypothetical protein